MWNVAYNVKLKASAGNVTLDVYSEDHYIICIMH